MASIVMPVAAQALIPALERARQGLPTWVAAHGVVSAPHPVALAPLGHDVAWQQPDGTLWRGADAAALWEAAGAAEDGASAQLAASRLVDTCRDALNDGLFGPPEALAMARGFAALAFDPEEPGAVSRVVLPARLVRQTLTRTDAVALVPVESTDTSESLTRRLETAWETLARWAEAETIAPVLPLAHRADAPGARDAWTRAVEAAVEAIAAHHVAKVVLARTIRVEADAPLAPAAVFAELASAAPGTHRFWFGRGETAFVGASPERLFRVAGARFSADGLAGTARRGGSEREDVERAQALLASTKDLHEHALVVEAIAEAVGPFAIALHVPDAPVVRRLATVQHLHTPIEATLRPDAPWSAILAAMHPTPAVGGTPRAAALPLIRRIEGAGRGWYAGPVGWISRDECEFAVGIRSAVLDGPVAMVWAGAGMVAGSTPDAEWEETERKALPFLKLLTSEEAPQ